VCLCVMSCCNSRSKGAGEGSGAKWRGWTSALLRPFNSDPRLGCHLF
jgi:hypothetical protein